jgi:hypothetical protein
MPPFKGHNLKIFHIISALVQTWSIHLIVYPSLDREFSAPGEYWSGTGVQVHPLRRRQRPVPKLLSVLKREPIPTLTRDFAGEYQIVTGVIQNGAKAKLLIDFMTGSPLTRRFRDGVVISGHDCMSALFREEAKWALGWIDRLTFRLRKRNAETMERKYYPSASLVHVVSRHDAVELHRIDPRIRTMVIPLSRPVEAHEKPVQLSARKLNVIWGNLGSPAIFQGTKRLLQAFEGQPAKLRSKDWFFIGRLSPDRAQRLFPELRSLGISYIQRPADIDSILSETRLLVLPDVGGTGQKTRLLDGLAHGCCVLGLKDAFLGLDGCAKRAGITCVSFDELLVRVGRLSDAEAQAIGEDGRNLLEEEFSLHRLRERWEDLLDRVPQLSVA